MSSRLPYPINSRQCNPCGDNLSPSKVQENVGLTRHFISACGTSPRIKVAWLDCHLTVLAYDFLKPCRFQVSFSFTTSSSQYDLKHPRLNIRVSRSLPLLDLVTQDAITRALLIGNQLLDYQLIDSDLSSCSLPNCPISWCNIDRIVFWPCLKVSEYSDTFKEPTANTFMLDGIYNPMGDQDHKFAISNDQKTKCRSNPTFLPYPSNCDTNRFQQKDRPLSVKAKISYFEHTRMSEYSDILQRPNTRILGNSLGSQATKSDPVTISGSSNTTNAAIMRKCRSTPTFSSYPTQFEENTFFVLVVEMSEYSDIFLRCKSMEIFLPLISLRLARNHINDQFTLLKSNLECAKKCRSNPTLTTNPSQGSLTTPLFFKSKMSEYSDILIWVKSLLDKPETEKAQPQHNLYHRYPTTQLTNEHYGNKCRVTPTFISVTDTPSLHRLSSQYAEQKSEFPTIANKMSEYSDIFTVLLRETVLNHHGDISISVLTVNSLTALCRSTPTFSIERNTIQNTYFIYHQTNKGVNPRLGQSKMSEYSDISISGHSCAHANESVTPFNWKTGQTLNSVTVLCRVTPTFYFYQDALTESGISTNLFTPDTSINEMSGYSDILGRADKGPQSNDYFYAALQNHKKCRSNPTSWPPDKPPPNNRNVGVTRHLMLRQIYKATNETPLNAGFRRFWPPKNRGPPIEQRNLKFMKPGLGRVSSFLDFINWKTEMTALKQTICNHEQLLELDQTQSYTAISNQLMIHLLGNSTISSAIKLWLYIRFQQSGYHDREYIQRSIKSLANNLSVSTSTIQKWQRLLKEEGYLEILEQKGSYKNNKPNKYRACIPSFIQAKLSKTTSRVNTKYTSKITKISNGAHGTNIDTNSDSSSDRITPETASHHQGNPSDQLTGGSPTKQANEANNQAPNKQPNNIISPSYEQLSLLQNYINQQIPEAHHSWSIPYIKTLTVEIANKTLWLTGVNQIIKALIVPHEESITQYLSDVIGIELVNMAFNRDQLHITPKNTQLADNNPIETGKRDPIGKRMGIHIKSRIQTGGQNSSKITKKEGSKHHSVTHLDPLDCDNGRKLYPHTKIRILKRLQNCHDSGLLSLSDPRATANELFYAIEQGSLRKYSIPHAINLGLKLIHQNRWTTPYSYPQ